MPATVVLVHGGWHGAWAWERVTPRLAAAGVPAVALDLPSVANPAGDLPDDVAAVRAVLDAVPAPIVLTAHSYGGAPVTEASTGHPSVTHLVYLSSFMLEAGESVMNSVAAEAGTEESLIAAAIRPRDDGTIGLDPEAAIPALYGDCTAADADWAVRRLRPQSAASLAHEVAAAGWHDIPSTFALCTHDRGVPMGLQRPLARRATHTVEMPTDHSPFLCRPDLVADLLVGLARD
jgi:hypothetical protein